MIITFLTILSSYTMQLIPKKSYTFIFSLQFIVERIHLVLETLYFSVIVCVSRRSHLEDRS